MNRPNVSPRTLARGAASLAGLVGAYNFLHLMGAFGPVSCWQSYTDGGTATENGTVTTTRSTVSHGCESGVDFLFGTSGPPGGGNAQVLFSWGFVLLLLVVLGVFGAWSGRPRLTWVTVLVGASVTVIGVFSIGWYFLLPTLFLAVAATALSVTAQK